MAARRGTTPPSLIPENTNAFDPSARAIEAQQSLTRSLTELIDRYGDQVWRDPKRCRGLLLDVCPQSQREIKVLVEVVEQKVPAELRAARGGVLDELLLGRLVRQVAAQAWMPEDAIRWAVETWATRRAICSV